MTISATLLIDDEYSTSHRFELFGRPWVLRIVRAWTGIILPRTCGTGSVIFALDGDRHDRVWPSFRMSCWPGKFLSVDEAVDVIRGEYRAAGAAA